VSLAVIKEFYDVELGIILICCVQDEWWYEFTYLDQTWMHYYQMKK